MKIIKGKDKNGQPIVKRVISGDDVYIMKDSEEKGEIVTLDEVLDDHKKEIGKLKSNVKYIYSYGGVGGNGHGGSGGGGGSTAAASLYISLNGVQIQSGSDNVIVLPNPGTYELFMNVSNSGGETFYVDYSYGETVDTSRRTEVLSMERNKCKKTVNLDLYKNGTIKIVFYDSSENILYTVEQSYIVDAYKFDIKLMYVFDNGTSVKETEFSKQSDGRYEYFIGNPIYQNPFVYAYYTIGLPNVTNVSLEYHIGDTDGESNVSYDSIPENPITAGNGTVSYGSKTDITYEPLKIYLGNLKRNGETFTSGSNMGTYRVSITLKYTVNNNPQVIEQHYDMTLIPSDLYINVRNPEGLLYDTEEELINDLNNLEEGQELEKSLLIGANTNFYCKVFEGPLRSPEEHYDISFNAYDYSESDDEYEIYSTAHVDGVTEQREMAKPFSVVFVTPGIKKLEFITEHKKEGSNDNPTIKYIYVRPASGEQIDWYPNITQQVFYFRANTSEPYSNNFPQDFGNSPIEMTENSSPVTISDYLWTHHDMNLYDATVLSFGMQYSAVNVDGAKILDTYDYGQNTPNMTLRADALFDSADKKICIPSESKYDKTVSTQYHLVQIVRCRLGYEGNTPQYATYLYIDGVLESNDPSITTHKYDVDRIVLNGVNASYNLISLQYLNIGEDNSIDGLIYQYYLAYKERMHTGTVTEAERQLLNELSLYKIKFDGMDMKVPLGFVETTAREVEIPTLMFVYTGNENTYDSFVESLFRGYRAGDTESFDPVRVDLYWSPGLADLVNIPVPSTGVYDDDTKMYYQGYWQVDLQGTSTMRNKIKNFALSVVTNSELMKILMSPNYDPNDPNSFLPEQIWTLKADIADSAHANNTAVGKFVNRNTTRFSLSNGTSGSYRAYVKNTLEGFPILLYFQVGPTIYYLGVYNFNMGRDSFYNLGYHSESNTLNMLKNLNESNASINKESPFKFSVGGKELMPNLAVGEVRENYSEFDFHQYDRSVLFQDDGSSVSKMFGKKKDMRYSDYDGATSTLENFVYSVATAGAYCFSRIKKDPVLSNSNGFNPETGLPYVNGNCSKKYGITDNGDGTHIEHVPDVKWQFYYDASDRKVWYQEPGVPNKTPITFEGVDGDVNNLLQCISNKNIDNVSQNDYGRLDFTSASEYYTTCMAFGLVDSILKNLTVKSWNGKRCYVSFYDMDCAFGENNAGEEKISYLASTDYWYSENSNGFIKSAEVMYDYWNTQIGPGFDYTSSYLFAIVKYAQAIMNEFNKTLGEDKQVMFNNYPQEYWAKLRNPVNGALKNADYFMNEYFSSGIGKIPAILASLNYQVKYLYYGTIYDEETGEIKGDAYLANEHAFNGTRIYKVRDWLNRRLHFLDVVFNVQGISMPIGNGYSIPTAQPGTLSALNANPDITIMSDMFTNNNNTTVIMESRSRPVSVYAPTNTPFVVNRGGSSEVYLLCAGTGNPNTIEINVNIAEPLRFLGSREFTDLNMVEPFLTGAKMIYSDKIQHIRCGSGETFPTTAGGLSIRSSSVKTISLPISTYSGPLNIDKTGLYGQALTKIDIHDSGFYGTWEGFSSLQELNISSVSAAGKTMQISQCPLLTGEKCTISGTAEKLTTLNTLNITGVSGKFTLEHTAIENVMFTSAVDKVSDITIRGDKTLKSLSLAGFRSIQIYDCPSLESLTITNPDKCTELIISVPYGYVSPTGVVPKGLLNFYDGYNHTVINEGETGTFDFTNFTSLEKLGFSGCETVERIKIPDRTVSIETFRDDPNLEFIDTTGENSCIKLTQGGTFFNCPCYGMRQSWGSIQQAFEGRVVGTDNIDNPNREDGIFDENTPVKYTKMSIDDDCKTLAQTFDIPYDGSSKYLNRVYTNDFGQKVYNKKIDMADAAWFVNTVIAGVKLDDAYIEHRMVEENNTIHYVDVIHDRMSGKKFGNDCRGNIESLQGCFFKQKGIFYDGSPDYIVPDLSTFVKLKNVSSMYQNTRVSRITRQLLSFPSELNVSSSPTIEWDNFIGGYELNISKSALKNISYRITSLSSMNLTIYDDGDEVPENYSTIINQDFNVDGWLDIRELFCNKDEHDEYIPLTNIKIISSFSINPSQWIDYRHMFEVMPNIESISMFLNNYNLSRSWIEGILKPKNGEMKLQYLKSVNDSFNHSGSFTDNSLMTVDLYDFFDWENTALYNQMTALFTSSNRKVPGFCIKKTISNTHFARILEVLHKYSQIDKLMNLFSYCTITDYDASTCPIVLTTESDSDFSRIESINSLFYNCKTDDDSPLSIRRSFFAPLKNVIYMANTFYNVRFDHMPSYDFFCKRSYTNVTYNIGVSGQSGISYSNNTLRTITYNRPIVDMYNCFCGAKFINCKSWFDRYDDVNTGLEPERDLVNNDPAITTYYKKVDGKDVEYKIFNYGITDTINNFTNYVTDMTIPKSASQSAESLKGINNHTINGDLDHYGNLAFGKSFIENDLNIYPAYCCLPPDIIHCCSSDCDLTNVFADTNIIGVLPQHMLKNCYNGTPNNMLRNVNIMPNLIYHYDKKCDLSYINNLPEGDDKTACLAKRAKYLALINGTVQDYDYNYLVESGGIRVDETVIRTKKTQSDVDYELSGNELDADDAIVLFRNSDGELLRRRPIRTETQLVDDVTTGPLDGEYGKSQFVYIPQGYSQNVNLQKAFTFRYNLPQQVNLFRSALAQEGIIWTDDLTQTNFDVNYGPDVKPWLWPYYTQYFMMVDESIDWGRVRDLSYPFITGEDDIDFILAEDPLMESRKKRLFSSGDQAYSNVWWNNKHEYVSPSMWHSMTNGILNIFFNLCGERDTRTGKIKDLGCPVSRSMSNDIKLDSFISGPLTAFLNGRLFDSSSDTGRFTTANCSSTIVVYDLGCGRGLIFPTFNYAPNGINNVPRIFITFESSTSIFYNFMFTGSIENYNSLFGISSRMYPLLPDCQGYRYTLL